MTRVMLAVTAVVTAAISCGPLGAQLFQGGVGTVDASNDSGQRADAGVDAGLQEPMCTSCVAFGSPRSVGIVSSPLVEVSGLAASRVHPGVLYAHNDSGDTARFFALSSSTATILQEFTLSGVSANDWEDLAVGPCPSGTCVFLGDIGDNSRKRAEYRVYRVAEPSVPESPSSTPVAVSFDVLRFVYPNGEKHNAETLLAHPSTGRLYVVSKEDLGTASTVFRFPAVLDTSAQMTLERVVDLALPGSTDLQVTGGDIDPCGRAVLLRMYNRLVRLGVPDGGAFEDAFTQRERSVSVAAEPQGEAVAYAADGQSYFTASEAIAGAPPLWESRCTR